MGWKLHVDAVGSHPKIFFLSLVLFSPEGKPIFRDGYPISKPLPKFTAVGNDTHAGGYIKSALWELKRFSKYLFIVGKHCVQISVNPVILNADRAVVPLLTGGPAPTSSAAAIFDVCFFIHCCFVFSFIQLLPCLERF